MFLQYGKINLKIVKFLLCERTAEYDPSGIDYLYTRWKISVEGLYTRNTPINVPYAVSYKASDPGFVPYGPDLVFPAAEYSAPVTDRSLIHALQVPRQRLVLSFGSANDGSNEVWAAFPSSTSYPCDLINGPIPLECSVQEIRGEGGMFLVRFTVETASNDCQINGGLTQYILSNRWTSTISMDENYFETRTFKGMAIFRADLIHRDHLQIDTFRPNILPPTPINCKRFIDELTVSPDGHTYNYTIRDVDQEVLYIDQPVDKNFTAMSGNRRNVTSIDAVVRRTYSQPGSATMINSFASELTNAMNSVGNFMQGLGSAHGNTSKDLAEIVGIPISANALQLGFTNALTALAVSDNVLPTFKETVTVTVWGNKLSRKCDLQELAFGVAFGQLTNQNEALILPAQVFQQVLTSVSNLVGAVLPPVLNQNPLQPVIQPAIANLPQLVAQSSALFNQAISLVSPVNNKSTPTAHIFTLEYDVFKRRVSVIIEQEYSGLLDFALGRQSLGRKAIWKPLPDNAICGDWPAFFKPKLDPIQEVGPFGIISRILSNSLENPPDIKYKNNLVGTVNQYNVPIGPQYDNYSRSGLLLQLIAADLTNTCKVQYQPLTNIQNVSTQQLQSIPNSNVVVPGTSLSTDTSPQN